MGHKSMMAARIAALKHRVIEMEEEQTAPPKPDYVVVKTQRIPPTALESGVKGFCTVKRQYAIRQRMEIVGYR